MALTAAKILKCDGLGWTRSGGLTRVLMLSTLVWASGPVNGTAFVLLREESRTVSKLYQNPIWGRALGYAESAEQIPQMPENAEQAREYREGKEG